MVIDSVDRRAERAQVLVAMGEISSGRAALEGDPIAPGNKSTLNSLRDESRRREPFPDHLTNFQPAMQFRFDWGESPRCANRREALEELSWAMFFGGWLPERSRNRSVQQSKGELHHSNTP